jgi:hypothetical protein
LTIAAVGLWVYRNGRSQRKDSKAGCLHRDVLNINVVSIPGVIRLREVARPFSIWPPIMPPNATKFLTTVVDLPREQPRNLSSAAIKEVRLLIVPGAEAKVGFGEWAGIAIDGT